MTTVTGLAGVQPAPPDGATEEGLLNLTLHVWRQAGPDAPGKMVRYDAPGISTHMSFLEMLDVVNERLIRRGDDPIAFDHDCREGICGMCGLVINGIAHGPQAATTTCQLHMRHFHDGDEIYVEPWRAGPFPVIKDLIVDRGALDRIVEAGGYITAPTGGAAEANAIPVPKEAADLAFDNAACISCGACVAACPNASAMLFTAAKVSHLAALPQGQPEREKRVLAMVATQDELGFGGCTNIGECAAVCPKEIPMESIARLNRELLRASLKRGRRK
ncbi:MAG TPA: succinate dehydrogenase/fumarate reductase iron-sulfur subunit [Acidimicrobiales bacterium]|jgi:succinate dehydrogenase / fumarate reductase iron-sulfur subunit|nr:succinate dehydrogenase/fumarate reductase iron-sulfur subunit [Acidimicrobiales bacterium]